MLTSILQLYRTSYGGLSRDTWWLSLVMLVNRSGTMVVPFLTMYLTQDLGVGIGKAGLVLSLFGMGAVLGGFLGGRLSDRFGFFYVQLFTLLGGGLMFLVLGNMHHFTGICIATFFLSLINEAFRPANSVAIAHYSSEENRTRSYSLNRLAVNLGWAVGSGIGGIIASFDYQWLFWVDGFTNISAAVLLLMVLGKHRQGHRETHKDEAAEVPVTNSAYQDAAYLWFILITTIFGICFFQLFTTLPVFYKTELALPESFIGLAMALNGILIACFEMIIVFRLEGRRPVLQYMSWGIFLIGISYCLLNAHFLPAAFIALSSVVVVTIGEIVSMPFMNAYWLSRTNATNRGQYAGLYTVAWAVAQAAGPFIGSQVVANFGYASLWWSTGIACFLLVGAFQLLQRRKI